jgi:hypothetical protein
MGNPYDERRKTLNLAAHKLRAEGKTNKEIAEQIGVRIEQVPGMVRAGGRISQLLPSAPMAASLAGNASSNANVQASSPALGIGGAVEAPPSGDAEA